MDQDGTGASDLAVPAVQMACKNAGVEVSEIDAIIFATLSPDYFFPGSGVFLGDKLRLHGVPALDVRNQCSGFFVWASSCGRLDPMRNVPSGVSRRW